MTLCKVIAYFCDEWGKFFVRKDTRQVNALDASSNDDNSVNESNHNYNYNNFAEQETQLLPVQIGAINGQNTHHTRRNCKTSHIDLHTQQHIQDMALIFGIPRVTPRPGATRQSPEWLIVKICWAKANTESKKKKENTKPAPTT